MMKLYVFLRSPRAFNVMAVANHLGLDYEIEGLNPAKGEHLTPQYAAINPNKRIPTLVEDGFIVWEANAITQYMASKKPEAGLLPADLRQRADVARWQFWSASSWENACGLMAFERVVKKLLGLGDPDPARVKEGEELFHKYAQVLNDHLKGRACLVGDRPTLADFAIAPWLNFAELGSFPVAPYGELKRWHAAFMALPACQKALSAVPR
ncbi:MAG TPA: glutathione S-transferase family protein [Candidatus Binataceae bacterium]|jgi:glutathione S-transferase|nr:glutathione S-transferase family protein [Candidatus Binataceae bacterium]